MTKELVIYHGGCRDGFAAAWVLNTALGADGADFHAGYYGQDPPDVSARRVTLVDFSYPRDVLVRMAAVAKVVFDLERSGAGIAWDYCNPGQPRPWLVDYVEDRDLWRNRLPQSPEVNAWISALPFDFATWDQQAKMPLTAAIEAGTAVGLKIQQYVREMRKNAQRIVFEGHNVPIVNCPQLDISELLDSLAKGEPFAMGWWQRHDGVFQYSLRSRGDFDVSTLARKHGGGGHKNAAGFELHEPPGWGDSPFAPPAIGTVLGAVPTVAR